MRFSSSSCAAISAMRGGRLVDLAALDADQAVLDDVDAADAVLAGEHVQLLDGLQRGHRDAVDRDRDALRRR